MTLPTPETNAYRLIDGNFNKMPGIIVDRYGPIALIYRYEGQCTMSEGKLGEYAQRLIDRHGLFAVWLKEFFLDRNQNPPTTRLLAGEATKEVEILENGLIYVIRPEEGYSPGLFLDQRENRRFLAGRAMGKKVWNGFAYTCGFSLACAAAGASEVVSVDLSKRYLDWGRENFEKNGLQGEHYKFFAGDVMDAPKRAYPADLVILDPPSFSRSKKTGVFSLKKDLEKLIKLGVEKTSPGGEFFFSCNHTELSTNKLKQVLRDSTKRKITYTELPPPPEDFPKETFPLSGFLARLD